MKRISIVTFLLLILSACSPKFVVNGDVSRPSEQTRDEIRSYWNRDSLTSLFPSSIPKDKTDHALEIVAFSETSINSSCKDFYLVKIVPDELTTFYVAEPGGMKRSYTPQKYLEWWYVNACGKLHRWRVFDDPASSRRVIALLYAKP